MQTNVTISDAIQNLNKRSSLTVILASQIKSFVRILKAFQNLSYNYVNLEWSHELHEGPKFRQIVSILDDSENFNHSMIGKVWNSIQISG